MNILKVILIILLCILIDIRVFSSNKDKLFSPVKLFFCLWTVIIVFSCMNASTLYEPLPIAYFLILAMLFAFFLGNLLYPIVIKKMKPKNQKETKGNNIRFIVFYILCAVVIAFNIFDLCLVLKYKFDGIPMWQIRNWTLEPFGSINPILSRRSFLETLLRTMILEPSSIVIHPIAAYYFFFDKSKKNKIFPLIASILVLVTGSLAGGGGRLGYIYFVMSYLLALWSMYRLDKIDKNKLKKYKKIIIAFLVTAFSAVVSFTIIRSGKGSFVKQTYKYFALPPTLLNEWIPKIENEQHTYGLLTTFGVHSYFFRTLDYVGLDEFVPEIFNKSFTHILNAEKFIPVGDGVANAFVTPIYYFYIDGGIIFVVIASMFFGLLITHMFKKISENFNIRYYIIYMLIMYGVLVSFMRIQTAMPSYIISIVMAYLLTYNSKKGIKNEEK